MSGDEALVLVPYMVRGLDPQDSQNQMTLV